MPIRYVVTHMGRSGFRTLISAAQGRNTFETKEAASEHLAAIMANNPPATLASIYGLPLEVRPVECWDMGDERIGDPKTVYFD